MDVYFLSFAIVVNFILKHKNNHNESNDVNNNNSMVWSKNVVTVSESLSAKKLISFRGK